MVDGKISRIQHYIKQEHLDGLLVGNFGHQIADDLLYYLLQRRLELGMMFIPKKGKPTLFAISFEVSELQLVFPEIQVRPYNAQAKDLLLQLFHKQNIVVGYRASALPSNLFKTVRSLKSVKWKAFNSHDAIVAEKFSSEIALMQKAARFTDTIFSECLEAWQTFSTETDVVRFLLGRMISYHIEPSFPPIVASGKHAARPHHHSVDKRLQHGFCVIDMGVRYRGYCSDMTRTIYLGKPSQEEITLYQTILTAQMQTIKRVESGITTKNLDEYCRGLLGDDLNKEFIHSLGHGLGTQVHEWPSVSSREAIVLTEGMVITIEPGVYREGVYGIRIEDDVLVTRSGSRILTKTDKKLILIDSNGE